MSGANKANGIDGVSRDKFEVRGAAGELEMNLSLGLVLFFPRGMASYGTQVFDIWNDLLHWRGQNVFSWARLGGGNKTRKMDAAAYRTVEGWLKGTKSFGRTCWIEINGGGDWEEIGSHSFAMDGRDESDDQLSAVDIRLPVETLEEEPVDLIAKRLCDFAGHLDFVCGTAGFMLHATPFGREELWPEMKKIVARYHCVEPDSVDHGEYTADFGLTGINWLTFVGAKHLESLGGANALKAKAAKSKHVTTHEVGQGLALRAGDRPRLGDRNKGSTELQAYREAYNIVKGAIFADADYPFDEESFGGNETVAWMHRFARP